MANEFPLTVDPAAYRVKDDALLTPVLAIYPQIVRHNIATVIAALGGKPGSWRPHVKTVKLGSMMKLLVEAGIKSAKCATTLELRTACEAGFEDILVSYPHTGRNARRVAEIARSFPAVRVSAIVETKEHLADWSGTSIDLFIDINTGMDRTGIEPRDRERVLELARQIRAAGLVFRGLHSYDGHSAEADLAERTLRAQGRYGELVSLVSFLDQQGMKVDELITAGTPALPAAIAYLDLWNGTFKHQVSPGTLVYCDCSSLRQIPQYGLRPAVVVVSSMISHPKAGIATCNAGHKAVCVDSGVPNCVVLGHPELTPLKPSEEHLPFAVASGSTPAAIGETLYLVPRHVCPTVNNFDFAALIEDGAITSVEPVSARGHEGPL